MPSPPPRPADLPARSPEWLHGIRILIVEDDADSRELLRQIVTSFGATVRVAEEGHEALAIAAVWTPDLILADLRMPKMDGAELYTRLQAERPAMAERVLFLSGDITQLAGRGLAPVARERVLVKPVELAELERRIQEFIRESGGGAV